MYGCYWVPRATNRLIFLIFKGKIDFWTSLTLTNLYVCYWLQLLYPLLDVIKRQRHQIPYQTCPQHIFSSTSSNKTRHSLQHLPTKWTSFPKSHQHFLDLPPYLMDPLTLQLTNQLQLTTLERQDTPWSMGWASTTILTRLLPNLTSQVIRWRSG